MKLCRLVGISICVLCAAAWPQDAASSAPLPADMQAPAAEAPADPAMPTLEAAPEETGEVTPAVPQPVPDAAPVDSPVNTPASGADVPAPAMPPESPASVDAPAGHATAQGASGGSNVRVTLDPPEIPFHKQTRFTIVVEAPAEADVKIPPMVDKFGGLSVYGQPTYSSTVLDKGRKQISQTYTLDPIRIGDYPIEPVSVTVNGEAIAVASPSVRVRDLTPEEKEEAERFVSAATPIDMPLPVWRRWEFWAAALLAVISAAALIWWLLRRREHLARPAPPLPPWEIAYQRLRELDERRLPQAGRTTVYYVELSSILRHYIEDRFTVHAPEQTTPEFLAEVSIKHIFSDDQQRMLATFLRHCDRVKFARYEPSVEEMDRSFADVLRFVDETKPRPDQASEEKVA